MGRKLSLRYRVVKAASNLFQSRLCERILLITLTAICVDSNAQTRSIDEIQVTANRRALSSSDSPSAVSIVAENALRFETLATDALAMQPGTFLQQTTPGQGSVIVRGLKGSQVLHLVDGMRVNNAIFRNAPTQYLALITPASIERIEVMRGPAASLYGNDAMAGVVHVLSRMPQFDDEANGVRGEFTVTADTAELTRSIAGTIEAGNRDISVLASVDYLDAGNRRTGAGARIAPSGFRSRSGRIAAVTNPNPGTSWLFDVQHLEQPNTPRVDELVTGFGQDRPSSSEFSFAPNRRTFAHVRHERQIGAIDWDFDVSWQRIDDDRISRGFESTERVFENNRSDLLGITVNGNIETGSTGWSFGAEHYQDRVTSGRMIEDIVSGSSGVVAARFPDDSRMNQGAVFAQVVRRFAQRHSLQGGLRFSHFDIRLAETQFTAGTRLKLDEISGDAGWLYHISEGLHFAVNIGRGVRAPNIFDLGTLGERPGNRFNIANPDLRPEKVNQFDVGIKANTTKLRLEFSLFRLMYRDRISSVLTGDVTADGRDIVQSRNVADADIWGVEFGAQLRLSDRFAMSTVLNYTHGEESATDSPVEPADRIPPLGGRLRLDYHASDALFFEVYLDFASTQSRLSSRDRRDPRIDADGTPGWATLNVRIRWSYDDRWQFRLGFENLLDKHYRNHGSGIDAPGRSLQASLRHTWGQ